MISPPNRQLNKCKCEYCIFEWMLEELKEQGIKRMQEGSKRQLWGYPVDHGELEIIDQCSSEPFITFGTFEQLGKPQVVLRQIKNRKPDK